jgi:UDP-glucuronate 4-epimerase
MNARANYILLTGCAGFVGMHAAIALMRRGHRIVGIDNLNPYYDVGLKKSRLEQVFAQGQGQFKFVQGDICHSPTLEALSAEHNITSVLHLAAQPGVRYSLTNPHAYVDSNVTGFLNVLELARKLGVEHLVFASSSSVYGLSKGSPFEEEARTDHPISLYAATKKANEVMAHAYASLFSVPSTGLRFFTVYGPWGRPDMAVFSFTDAIVQEKPITLFAQGKAVRDFTYVDDIVEGICRVLQKPPTAQPAWDEVTGKANESSAPYRILNIGNHAPVAVERLVVLLEEYLGKNAIKKYAPLADGDVPATFASVDAINSLVGFKPDTSLEVGLARFVNWYKTHYGMVV